MVTEKYIHVGDHELFYLGRIYDLAVHSHLTWTLCFALDANFHYNSPIESLTTKQPILIPPNLKHKIEAKGSFMVFIFFEKYSTYVNCDWNKKNVILQDWSLLNDLKHEIQNLLLSKNKVNSNISTLIQNLQIPIQRKQIIDPRISKVLEIISILDLERDSSIKELASSVNLSESRLSHLFKQEMGLPISSYKIWMKIKKLSISIKKNKNLTFAAQESGFFDSSHLNRVFKSYFGINPKKIFTNSIIHWI
ncbi:MAG: AraC family transcriptional regulator [Leptospiraceae bacterium]|nr:AraC family transcriptional regulator [Leptospiraceae bacterium]